jgi:hypothetical protein
MVPAGGRQIPVDCNRPDEQANEDRDLIAPFHIVSTTRNSAFPLNIRV